jgi:RNA polymerase-associated protein CTR9
VIHIQ